MITCKALNTDFETREEMFKALKEKKNELIDMKKSAVKNKDSIVSFFRKTGQKAEPKPLEIGDTVKVAMNTVGYLDYDMDVLVKNAWNKSAQEQNGKTYHVCDHQLKIGSIVGYPKDVSISVEDVAWKQLGFDYEGKTQVLVFETKMTEKTNRDAFLAYKDGEDVQHSIRLQYVKIEMALNSEDEADKEEKAVWDKYYPSIINKEIADEAEYFFCVKEARILKEGSTVLFGANEATPQLKSAIQPPNSTESEDNDPPQGSQDENIYEFLINNLKK